MIPSTLLSISNHSLRNKEYYWCQVFLEENKNRIIGDTESNSYYRLCNANYLFYIGQIEEALTMIEPSYPSIEYSLFSKCLEIKCYHELNSDLADYKLDAYRVYLVRAAKTTINQRTYEPNLNFVYMLQQLRKHPNPDEKTRAKLVSRIQSKQLLADREWLLSKLEH
jgi:hypothetical protein